MDADMIIVEMRRHFEVRAIEWWSAGCLVSWGLVLLLFPALFTSAPYSVIFRSMDNWAPQNVWGLCAFSMGLFRLMALFINGFWHRTPQIRLGTSFLSVCVWFFITAGMIRSNVPLGIVLYGWHVVADIYSSFRSASDTVEASAQKRLRQLSRVPGESNVCNLNAG